MTHYILLSDLLQGIPGSYVEQCGEIQRRIDRGEIRPVKAGGLNGMTPPLYKKYRIFIQKEMDPETMNELDFKLAYIDPTYYKNHPEDYAKDRGFVFQLNDFLKSKKGSMTELPITERSLEIWNDEKMLEKTNGKGGNNVEHGYGLTILRRCGIPFSDLHCYRDAEPLVYTLVSKNTPQNILIIENKATYCDLRNFLMEGKRTLFGKDISAVIFGGGRRIQDEMRDFDINAEPCMLDASNTFLYYGDVDYIGLSIYEHLAAQFPMRKIVPFADLYHALLQKAEKYPMQETKQNQKDNLTGAFMQYFEEKDQKKIQRILESRKYVPQERLNKDDLEELIC